MDPENLHSEQEQQALKQRILTYLEQKLQAGLEAQGKKPVAHETAIKAIEADIKRRAKEDLRIAYGNMKESLDGSGIVTTRQQLQSFLREYALPKQTPVNHTNIYPPYNRYLAGEIHQAQKAAGALLRQLRKEKGLSHEIFGRKIAYTKFNISNLEYGRTPIPLDKIPIILEALNTTPEKSLQLRNAIKRVHDLKREEEMGNLPWYMVVRKGVDSFYQGMPANMMLRYFRIGKDLSQGMLATKIHVTQQALFFLEEGTNFIPKHQIVPLIEALELNPQEQDDFREAVECQHAQRVAGRSPKGRNR